MPEPWYSTLTYLNLQDQIGIGRFTSFIPRTNFKVTELDAYRLAQDLRHNLGLGTVPVADVIPHLEIRGIRIFFTKLLPYGIKAKGYFDEQEHSYLFALSETATTEGQVYELAAELAYMFLFERNACRPVPYTNAVGVFVRAFAGCFLMPQETLIDYVNQLAISPDAWTFELVCALKWRFGVSAHAFIYRLVAGNLISGKRFKAIKEQIHDYYKENPDALEPKPAPRLRRDTWISTLKARASSIP